MPACLPACLPAGLTTTTLFCWQSSPCKFTHHACLPACLPACRPNDYNPAAAAALGPSGPNPNLNLSAIGLGASKGGTCISGRLRQGCAEALQ